MYLVSGQFVPPIHRKNLYSLQYSMLPVQRVGVGELWRLLNEGRDGENIATANGHDVSAHGRAKHGRSKPGQGYWWSR